MDIKSITNKLNPYSRIKELEGESSRQKRALRSVTTKNQKTRELTLDWRTRVPEMQLQYLYNLADSNRTLKFTIKTLRDEIFRSGFEWKEKFACKCLECDAEYEYKTLKCRCGSENFIEPNLDHIKEFDRFMEKCNPTQSLKDVFKQMSLDYDTVDEGWIICKKKYLLFEGDPEADNYGDIAGSTPIEISRGDPLTMRYVIDEYDRPGGDIWICLVHRDIEQKKEDKKCKECGRNLHQAIAAALGIYSKEDDLFYIEGEVYHNSKHNPTELYSKIPPVMECYFEVFSLIWAAYNIKNYYENDWMAGFFTMNTDNPDDAFNFWERVKADLLGNRYNPIMLPFSSKDGRGKVEFHSVSDIFKESNHQAFRDGMERAVATHYGVANVFRGDASTGIGLSNEGMQLKVTDRACDVSQGVFHDGPIPFLMAQFHITDYVLQIKPVAEKDEAAEVQLDTMKANYAKSMMGMGYVGTRNPQGDWDFTYNIEKAAEIMLNMSQMSRTPMEPLSLTSDLSQGPEPREQFRYDDKVDSQLSSETEGNLQERINKDDIIIHTLEDTHDSKAFLNPNKELILGIIKAGFLWDNFKNFSLKEVDLVHDVLFEKMTQPQGWSMNSIVKDLQKALPGKSLNQLENITKTETTEIMNTAREISYKESDTPQQTYRWVGPDQPGRTTKICTEIKRRVGAGKPLEDVKRILHEVASKYENEGGTPDRNMTPHYRCRHTLLRATGVVGKAEEFLEVLENSGNAEILEKFKAGESAHSISKSLGIKRKEVDKIIRAGIK
ncbi:hypothetical protein KAR91_44465 [Candidatus Pacearchaeota archaeon]|nr:hypothetical protein [Candidatus Pacearchaeota archaeon]